MYRPHMIDRNQMLVAASLTASRHQIGIARCRSIRAGTVLMCMIPRSGWNNLGPSCRRTLSRWANFVANCRRPACLFRL